MERIFIVLACTLICSLVFGQTKSVKDFESQFLNWHNKDYALTGILGAGVDKAHQFLKDNPKVSKTIIVAVIDSGIDIDHEDLKGNIWINDDEIPENGIDDDQNGYVDDIHGWNFIGSHSGENIHFENLEYTRIVRKNSSGDPNLEAARILYNSELEKYQKEKENIEKFQKIYDAAKSIIKSKTGVIVSSKEDLMEVKSKDERVIKAKGFLEERYSIGFSEEILETLANTNKEHLDYYLNIGFDPRDLIGDNPDSIADKFYGTPDVKGPRPDHGTSVAGVIAAIRDNGIGINGIATNVKIMAIRSTPRGDERDKDVALSIYYAVENGADIINMSFGKEFSPRKDFVDEAVKYAEQRGVLLVHASGNSGKNIDLEETYPSDRYLDSSESTCWLNVGASCMQLDQEVAASFSNYGQKHVDIFAPGVDIISTDSSDTYSKNDGTSLAAPVVSGIAALILSYYPELKSKDLILTSSYKLNKPKKVLIPSLDGGKRGKAKFAKLSKSGGVVNAYNALIEQEKE